MAQPSRPVAPEALPAPARIYAVGVQCLATSLGFFLTAVIKLPIPLYFPLSRRWSTTPNPEELSMDFFSRSLFAIVVGALAGALTLAIFAVGSGRKSQAAQESQQAPQQVFATSPESHSGLTLLTGYAATALALAAGVFGYQLYGRPPAPEPLPPGLSTLQTAEKPSALPPRPGARQEVLGKPKPAAPAASPSVEAP